MKLPRKQANVVRETIERWKQDGVIPEVQAAALAATIEVQYFDWRKLAKYSFWIALFSIVTSVSAALSDRMLQELLEVIFQAPAMLKCFVLALVAAGLFRWGLVRRAQSPDKGALEGRILLNEDFTAATMQAALQQQYPAVHIASHFQLAPGNETDSYLLLGDGSALTLAQLKQWPRAFAGVALLTLSACETGVGDGREIESFGELAQRQGAGAVLATLLRVPDQSTARLMPQFYRQQATLSNAEALRQAQLDLLRSPQFKHPFYWAPFLLIDKITGSRGE